MEQNVPVQFSIEITFKQGRWLVNDKRIQDLDGIELEYLNEFFRAMKTQGIFNN